MKLSTTTYQIAKKVGLKEAVTLIKKAGFDAVDLSNLDIDVTNQQYDKSYFTEIKKYADSIGIYFNQSHAPYPSSYADDENKTKEAYNKIVKSIENASYLGINHIVVHPCHHLKYYEEGNPSKLFEINMEFYNSLIPYSEEYGVKIALENMWRQIPGTFSGQGKISNSVCSTPDEFIKYLRELNNDCFIGCFDIGHCTLVCQDAAEFILKLGSDRIKAVHVHDVDGISDTHTIPHFGIVDWDKVMKALKKINYQGDFTYEAYNYFKSAPTELLTDYLVFAEKIGRHLIKKFDNA